MFRFIRVGIFRDHESSAKNHILYLEPILVPLRIAFLIYLAILAITSALGNVLIIIILLPQCYHTSKMRTSRHIKIKISLGTVLF